MKKRIFILVSDKTGLEKFKRLADLGWDIISINSSLETLKELKIPCYSIKEIFTSPLNYETETTNNILASFLINKVELSYLGDPRNFSTLHIDMVVINMQYFDEIENKPLVDIGSHTVLMAACKNAIFTIPICDPNDYDKIIGQIEKHGDVDIDTRHELAFKGFEYILRIDNFILDWMRITKRFLFKMV